MSTIISIATELQALKEWADIRAFELHEHEASAARMATVSAVFGLDAPSEEETNAEIEAFHGHVDATAEALIEAYRRGLAAGRALGESLNSGDGTYRP